MGCSIKQFQLIIALEVFLASLSTFYAQADGADDYYRAIRKAGAVDAKTREKIKAETFDAARIREVNALAAENAAHIKKIESQKPPKPSAQLVQEMKDYETGKKTEPSTGTPSPEQLKKQEDYFAKMSAETSAKTPKKASTAIKKTTSKPDSNTTVDSGPAIKVESNLPDEMEFSGPEEPKTKKADAVAPAPKK